MEFELIKFLSLCMFLCVYVSANPPILLFDMNFPLLVCLPNIKIGKVRVL